MKGPSRWLLGLALALAFAPSIAANADAGETSASRLATEASPYLRLHADDPVDWWPYGEPAFDAARAAGRIVFVSIGYATCHWCRVMERESYRDPAVAAALAVGFIAVKVDRDERPDVAESYARMLAAMGEPVGWPLHVFLLPDGTAFFGATYLPRTDRPGRPGILTVLASVREAAAAGAPSLARRGAQLRAVVERSLVEHTPSDARAPDEALLERVAEALLQASDAHSGGTRTLPKRPTEPSVPLLLRSARRGGPTGTRKWVGMWLTKMAAASIRGEGGGFYEAAGARDWSRPRTEFRLADNALLALAYLEAWQATGDAKLRDVARDALRFVIERLPAPGGGFVTSLREGRAEPPQDDDAAWQRDEQVLADANGLALSALARAGFALSDPPLVEAARDTARVLLERQRAGGVLHRTWARGRLGARGRLSDSAFVVGGLLDLLEADPDPRWLEAALDLQREQDERFGDVDGGYFLTERAPGPGLPRPKHARDGALPAANAVSASNLLRFYALTGDAVWLDRSEALFAAFADAMRAAPGAHAGLAAALDARLEGVREIAIVVAPTADPEAFLAPLRERFVPNRVLLVAREGPDLDRLAGVAPLLANRPANGAVTAYVCRNQVCALPADSPAALAKQLGVALPR